MTMGPSYPPDGGQWRCGRCGCPLEQGKVQVFFLNSAFDVFFPCCPQRGPTMAPKSLAVGKMLEGEALLEDK